MQWRSAEDYRKRAQELREAAFQMSDEAARDNLLDLAKEYETMAEKTRPSKGDGKAGGKDSSKRL